MGDRYNPAYEKRVIEKLTGDKGYIRVWKVVKTRSNRSYPIHYYSDRPFDYGINAAVEWDAMPETWGFHAFRDHKSAEQYAICRNEAIIECLALPEWVRGCGVKGLLKTILFTHLCFPTYPDLSVTVRDFRRMVRLWKQATLRCQEYGAGILPRMNDG